MFSSPTAIRVLKKQDPALLKKHDTSSLRALFLAGEPLDEPTARWIGDGLGLPGRSTTTGRPRPAGRSCRSRTASRARRASSAAPSFPMYGYDVRIIDEATGEELGAGEKGVVAIVPPLPPGCMKTVWGDDERFVDTYFKSIPGRARLLDVRLGHPRRRRLLLHPRPHRRRHQRRRPPPRHARDRGSRSVSHAAVAECAVVGVADALKGQVPVAFAVLRDAGRAATPADALKLEGEVMAAVDRQLGAVARPSRVHFVGCCRRRARARWCGARSRRSASGATRAT